MNLSLRAGKTVWIELPEKVGREALAEMADAVAAAGELQVVFDCSRTRHIDFRELRRFGARLRRTGRAAPIAVVALTRYCRNILRFGLELEDLEMFEEVDVARRPTEFGEARLRVLPIERLVARWRSWDDRLGFAHRN